MESLFDRDKPHFEEWRTLYDIDSYPLFDRATGASFKLFAVFQKTAVGPLYYAALCGFHDLAERLIIKYPQDVNANGGHLVRPLVAALARQHFRTADLLRQSGADPDPRGDEMRTPLHSAAYYGDLEVVQKLIEYNANIAAEDDSRRTSIYNVSEGCCSEYRPVLRLLLDHGVDINARTKYGSTPLHIASTFGPPEVVSVLLERGADVNVEDERGKTALQVAEERQHNEIVKLLLEYKAK